MPRDLERTEQQIRGVGATTKADRLDVMDREAMLAYADDVRAHFRAVNQIYNNAGMHSWATSRSPR